MLVRAYRVSDKLGVISLKLAVLLADAALDGIGVLWRTLVMGVLLLVRPLIWLINTVFGLFTRGAARVGSQTRDAADNAMARRAARVEMTASVVEDPLKAQNRALSVLTVLLLVALIGAILYATNPARSGPALSGNTALNTGLDTSALFAPEAAAGTSVAQMGTPIPGGLLPNAVQPTAVPIATLLPAALSVRGAIAYTVRELGQTDIWALSVGSREPLRVTSSAADDRDPAWSPNGRQLAYSTRQDGNWEIYLLDITSGALTRMTYDLSFQAGPSWSPDGAWLVYESYQGDNLDVYLMRVDGSLPPIRMPGNSDAPDFAPAWSPDGRRIAFVSLRDGRQDLYVFSLDDESVVNVTNTPGRDEDHPAWYPDDQGDLLAYSALDGGAEKVFVQSTLSPNSAPQVLSFGRTPSWSPDGGSIVFMADSGDATQLTAYPFTGEIVGTPIIPVPLGAAHPSWTRAPLPQAFINSGGAALGAQSPLYIEQENRRASDPPYPLQPLPNVNVENAALSDRVNDSFNALREAAARELGWDFMGRLDDAFWSLERPPEPGEERRNWLMTGRSFAVTRSSVVGFPPPLEVVREDIGVGTAWRLFVRADDSSQSGELGEPLRRIPWDFASRTAGDVEAYDQGGRVRALVPSGYYVDYTQSAFDYGWTRVDAGDDWRANANSVNYWLFRKTDGLSWFDAMLEIYPAGQLINFAPTVAAPPLPAGGTPLPTATAPIVQVPPTQPPPTPLGITGDSAPETGGADAPPDAP